MKRDFHEGDLLPSQKFQNIQNTLSSYAHHAKIGRYLIAKDIGHSGLWKLSLKGYSSILSFETEDTQKFGFPK